MGVSQVSEPLSAVGGGIIAKLGGWKIGGPLAALIGALMIASARLPKSRVEWFSLLVSAVGVSLLAGSTAITWADWYFDFIDLATATQEQRDGFVATVHGALGMVALGVTNFALHVRDKLSTKPDEVIEAIAKPKRRRKAAKKAGAQ